MRKTLTPAWIIFSMTSSLEEAGPSVATIFVFFTFLRVGFSFWNYFFWFHFNRILTVNQSDTQHPYEYPEFNKIMRPNVRLFRLGAPKKNQNKTQKRNTGPEKIMHTP